jgi:sigma-B regulation protein RsbU (phosphoserine phosphatase)
MYPAREVGGDFYDFFFIDDDHLVFLIADVSGKGIPAALFMMTTKTLIKNLAKTGLSADELITQANKQICKTNEQGIFVTVFLSILELSTGKINCINAGHNPPLFKEKNKDFKYYKCTPNLVVGAMENTVYHSFERKIHPGDCIFLYTDGITEAYNKEDEFYGEERLVEFLNTTKSKNTDIENILLTIKEDVENFAQGEEQADDMTMLILRYNGVPTARKSRAKTKTFLLPADTSRIDSVTKWIQENCTEAKIPDEHKQKLHLAVEEIFVNISNYAYPKGQGDIEISFKIIDGRNAQIQFIDSGKPYNPLEKEDPDITLNAEERAIGGLGIFLAKQMVDIMEYEFRDDRNILTIQLAFLEN